MLSSKNAHFRDKFIKFYNKDHKYIVENDTKSTYTSVTTWNKSFFAPFDENAVIQNIYKGKTYGPSHKYWNMTPEQIKNSWKLQSSTGTQLHERIGLFMNNYESDEYTLKDLLVQYEKSDEYAEYEKEPEEWKQFIMFVKDHPYLIPFRTEWFIFDEELKLAGSIDMVFKNDDGTLSIYDWKRSGTKLDKHENWNRYAVHGSLKHIPDTKYWIYSIQLNTYKMILERKYGKSIKSMHLVKLHPKNASNNYEIHDVDDLSEEIKTLMNERKSKFEKMDIDDVMDTLEQNVEHFTI